MFEFLPGTAPCPQAQDHVWVEDPPEHYTCTTCHARLVQQIEGPPALAGSRPLTSPTYFQ